MATKKAKVTAKSKKTTAAKKSTPVKKVTATKKIKKKAVAKKVAAKKVVAKKIVKVKAVAKKVASKKAATPKATKKVVIATSKPIAKEKPVAIEKVTEVVLPKITKEKPKPLSTGQQKKVSAKKKISEQESVLRDTFSAKETVFKNTLPIDHAAFKLVKSIVNAIEEKKGDNIVCLDIRNIENRVCDYFIICDGNSTTQIDAIAGSVEFMVKKELGERPYRSEGWDNATWILIDYVNVIVHVFDKETRHFYNLESLWADGERMKV